MPRRRSDRTVHPGSADPRRLRGLRRRDRGVPKAGVFAEGVARVVAESILATVHGGDPPAQFDGRGSCYIEFGSGRVGRVDIDFLSGPRRTGTFQAPSAPLVQEKRRFGSSRRATWFS